MNPDSIFPQLKVIFNRFKNRLQSQNTLIFLLLLVIIPFGFAQKGNGNRNKAKDLIVRSCTTYIGNGLYSASFSYDNPTNQEINVAEDDSFVKYNNGNNKTKSLNKFKKGNVSKAFTKEFRSNGSVEWTVIQSNGKTHTVVANANSSHCTGEEEGFIFPVIGNGKSFDIIGQELTSICEDVAGDTPSELIFQIDNAGKVLVEIVPIDQQMANVISLLQGAPFGVQPVDFLLDLADYNSLSAIDVYLAKDVLCLLNDWPQYINFARPVYPASNNSGGVITQGDAAQTSNLVRESFRTVDSDGAVIPVDGTGIKIGVLSDSYDMALGVPTFAALDVANGELPPDVELLKDNKFKASDEGRAMMQLIYDVAPGAKLAFHTATASPRQFELAFKALKDAQCDIIVDDITFITEPFFGTGRVSDSIQTYVGQGNKFHFTSAGNLANKGFQSTFSTSSTVPTTNFIDPESQTRAHLFDGTGDYLQKISVVPGTYLIALQWKEELASQGDQDGASDDLDIYVVDDSGRLLVGNNRVNIAGDPTEIIVFRSTGTGDANILITSANGATNVPFRYIAFRTAGDNSPNGLTFLEYFGNGAPTVSGHAMTPESVTVGAVDYRNAASPIAETFSSYGGLLSDGISLGIDLYAPDGGNTSSTTIGQDAQCATCDQDGILNFYGTSAAAPHFAGAVALLMSATPSWFPDGSGSTTYTTGQALQLFKSTATGFTAADGSVAGFLNTFAAFDGIAAQTAKITELMVEDGKTPSAEPFTVTIIGEFFPENLEDLEILFDGQPLEDVQIVTTDGKTVITASVPTFSGNPALLVVTNGITPGGTDGGESDPAYFFDDGKLALNIIANSAQFEYGQDITSYYRADLTQPGIIPPYTVEGLPEGVTFESLVNLPPVVLNNTALDEKLIENGYPVVFDYVITPSFGDQNYDQNLYQINFISGYIDPDPAIGKVGYLTVTKKDLTITPAPITYTYGDAIDLTLNYSYDATGISDNSPETGFYSLIDATHQSDFKDGLPNKFKAVVSKFKAVVSGYDLVSLLNGGSWSASERTIQNKFKAVVSTMNIIDLDNDDFTNYIVSREAFDDGTTNKFKAVVSKFKAVVSGEDLFAGDVDLGIGNKFKAVVSKFKAVVSEEDPSRPYSTYESVFAIIDAEDAPPEDGSDDERAISDMFALNMITGLEVTPPDTTHYVYSGAFLNAMAANFNITYAQGSLTILSKGLAVSTDTLTIPYGELLTKSDLTTSFDGWVFEGEYQESVSTVFPELDGGIPYYFIKEGGDGTELEIGDLKELGDYLIKIRDPQNYVITHTVNAAYGTLTIDAAPLTFSPEALTIEYGETPVIEPNFGLFAYDDDASDLTDATYYFKKEGDLDTYYTLGGPVNMGVGVYEIFINDDPTDNYKIVFAADRGTLTVEAATLTIKTTALELEYGDSVSENIVTSVTGFAYNDENSTTVFPNGILYKFVKGTEIQFDIVDVKELGTYSIEVKAPALGNYVIGYDPGHGDLTITEATLTFTPILVTIVYGETPEIEPNFTGFAPDEDASVLEDAEGKISYYFMKDGEIFTMVDPTALNVGLYDVFITDEVTDNYKFSDTNLGTLEIGKADLYVTISPDHLIINQGDIPQITADITGYVYGETEINVFPGGLPYYFVDEDGYEKSTTDTGLLTIKIEDPENYVIIYNNEANLLINPDDVSKIQTFADCVVYDPLGSDGLFYTVTYRYENANDDTVYVLEGADNKLSGPAQYNGQLPIAFLPGSGTFEIRFNGKKLVWSLTTNGSTHKSSVSSANQSGTGECDGKLDGSYSIGPNPVSGSLNITQNIIEVSTVFVYNMYGALVINGPNFNGTFETKTIDMSTLIDGLYIVRIVSDADVRTYNILKQ